MKSEKQPLPAVKDPASDPALRLGGVALSNGLIVVSAAHWAAAIREEDGSISVASGKKPLLPGTGEKAILKRGTFSGGARGGGARSDDAVASGAARGVDGGEEGIPVVRGLGRFAESMLVLGAVKKRLPGARLPFESREVFAALVASMAGSTVVRALAPRSALIQEAGTALAAFVPAMVAVKDSPVSGYHGAEHKVIGAREEALRAAAEEGAGGAKKRAGAVRRRNAAKADLGTVAGDAAAAPKEHDRCGSNLVGPFLFASVLANVLARGRYGRKTPLRATVAGAASLGLALEGLRWADKHPDSLVARMMMLPGKAIQSAVTTSEPTPEQLEVGQRALEELLRLESAAR